MLCAAQPAETSLCYCKFLHQNCSKEHITGTMILVQMAEGLEAPNPAFAPTTSVVATLAKIARDLAPRYLLPVHAVALAKQCYNATLKCR